MPDLPLDQCLSMEARLTEVGGQQHQGVGVELRSITSIDSHAEYAFNKLSSSSGAKGME